MPPFSKSSASGASKRPSSVGKRAGKPARATTGTSRPGVGKARPAAGSTTRSTGRPASGASARPTARPTGRPAARPTGRPTGRPSSRAAGFSREDDGAPTPGKRFGAGATRSPRAAASSRARAAGESTFGPSSARPGRPAARGAYNKPTSPRGAYGPRPSRPRGEDSETSFERNASPGARPARRPLGSGPRSSASSRSAYGARPSRPRAEGEPSFERPATEGTRPARRTGLTGPRASASPRSTSPRPYTKRADAVGGSRTEWRDAPPVRRGLDAKPTATRRPTRDDDAPLGKHATRGWQSDDTKKTLSTTARARSSSRYANPETPPKPQKGLSDDEAQWAVGRNAVLTVLKTSPKRVFKLLVADGLLDDRRLSQIKTLAKTHRIPVVTVPRMKLDSLLTAQDEEASHQGIAASVTPRPLLDLHEYLRAHQGKPDDEDTLVLADRPLANTHYPLLLMCDGITDPRNFGAMIRVACGAGVDAIVVGKHTGLGFGPAVSKTAVGADTLMDMVLVSNLSQALRALKEAGFWIVGATRHETAIPYTQHGFDAPTVLVMGSEEDGLSRLVQELCDVLVEIPMMNPAIDSLNVASATAVLLYDALGKRKKPVPVE